MKKKQLVPLAVLLAVVILLGVALAVVRGMDAAEEDTGIALCTLDPDAVTALRYTGADAAESLTKTDDTWTLDSQPNLPIDQDTAAGVATAIANLRAQRDLGAEADTSEMGFDDPTMTLTLTAGEDTFTLTLGAANEMTGTTYAQVAGSDNVYTVNTDDLSGICLTPKELYAAQDITDIETGDIATMSVVTSTETLNFTRTDGTWTLTDDPDYPLDQDAVNRMANTITALQSSWSILTPADDTTYGFDNPDVIVNIVSTDGTSVECVFGGLDPEDDTLCYLRSSNASGVVYEVDADQRDTFAVTRASLEDTTATAETAESATDDIIAENPVGGAGE